MAVIFGGILEEGIWVGYEGIVDSYRAQFYRAEAKRLREKAVVMDSPEIRQALEDIANQYELLAKDLESAAKHSPPRKAPPERG
jgi:hypothetical protein